MKKFFEEFKEFISRGSVMDMAVGIIIGGAFTAIVTSLVDDIISPLLGLFGDINFDQVAIVVGGVSIGIGKFITAIINFIIMALVIFCIVKAMNTAKEAADKKLGKTKDEAPTEKDCPYCFSKIPIKATRCPHCTSEIKE